jgi:phosphatidylglycerophosphate synthase
MFTPFKFFWNGLKNISPIESLLIVFDITTIVIAPRYCFDYYLWSIVLLCDLGLVISHGAWMTHSKHTRPVCELFPWRRTEGITMRILMLGYIVCVTLFMGYTGSEIVASSHLERLSIYCWYLIVFSAVYELFYCILKTLHAIDSTWLEGTKGHIGIPNAISIIRIALALCVPHIYATMSFGAESYTIASIILGLALSTDAIDGYIARSMHQITKAGKALDPLGDKLIFYPVAVGFYLAAEDHFVRPIESIPSWLAYAAAAAIILRDILVIIWYLIFGKRYKDGISAGYADKIRAIILSAWLVSTALAITIPETSLGIAMIWISWTSLLFAGIVSPISFAIDIYRIIKYKRSVNDWVKNFKITQ